MPERAKRPCGKAGCNQLANGKYCESHLNEGALARKTPMRKLYSTKRWEATRREVITSDPVCKLCGMRASQVAHHKIRAQVYAARDMEMFFDLSNLEGVCKSCHDAETAHEVGFAGGRGEWGV